VHIFSVISFLKQICNDPALIDPRYEDVSSGKLALFDEILSEALASEQKVVVFSQYAKMVNRLSERLGRRGVNHVILTGQSTNRGALVKQFQEDPQVKVFIGSLLAGGTGIDLTAANVVIHFDRWWNAAKENQATDRIHRIGQQKNVQVYKLVTKGTLEERIDEIINRKKLIFERFVEEDSEIFKNLSREDLLKLLAPAKAEDAMESAEDNDTPSMDALVHEGVVESHQI
jgi:SNF2 family DNA or RNA helicase